MQRRKFVVMLLLFVGAFVNLSGQSSTEDNVPHRAFPSIGSYPDPTPDLFIAFPNPNSTEQLSIELDHEYIGTMSVQVYDVYGRLYYNQTVDKFSDHLEFDIDASGWAPGMYVIVMIGSDVCGSQRVLKE